GWLPGEPIDRGAYSGPKDSVNDITRYARSHEAIARYRDQGEVRSDLALTAGGIATLMHSPKRKTFGECLAGQLLAADDGEVQTHLHLARDAVDDDGDLAVAEPAQRPGAELLGVGHQGQAVDRQGDGLGVLPERLPAERAAHGGRVVGAVGGRSRGGD